MKYSEFVKLYEKLASTTKKLEKAGIIAEFLPKLKEKSEWIYLLRGKASADYDSREFGISTQLCIKSIASSSGVREEEVVKKFRKIGDLGDVAEEFMEKKRQSNLFSSSLKVEKVFENLNKIMNIDGKGAVERKISLISELLNNASGKESKYIIRTLLNDLRIGVADAILIDAIAKAFFHEEDEIKELLEEKYDLANDSALVLDAAFKGRREIEKINIVPGKPMKVMLAVKADDIKEAFRICGSPAIVEYKYDGFRVLINKNKNGGVSLFTRRLENVTKQFPDVVSAVSGNIRGESFILDSEVVGYDRETKKYKPFESISQRIKRKYDIEKLQKELPVEINVFDVIYYNGESLMNLPFNERRKVIEKIIKEEEWKIRPAMQKIVDNEEDALAFYKNALKTGEEGIMIKKIDAPYKSGRKVGYMAKLKPSTRDFDLVIVGAEYGTGKRAGWLTSYIVACNDNGKFLEVGKVSSGLKEKEEEGTTYEEITKLLKPLIVEQNKEGVKVKPKIIVSVTYQNIQESPSYNSGFALRFPRIIHYRPDKKLDEITTLDEIKKEARKGR